MKLKVSGMKFTENIEQVSGLYPDYMGFIFYEKSKRNFEGVIPKLPKSIKKTGVFVNKYPEYQIINIDALTYAGNLENLRDIEGKPNYKFAKINILNDKALDDLFDQYRVTDVIHLAAESHVDRSIISPLDFVYTAKLVYGVEDLATKGKFDPTSKILIIHSGGLQGNRSFKKGTFIF